jgi:hypothetical protein
VQEWAGENVRYHNVIDHMFASLSGQLNTTDVLSPALVISHLVIDTRFPCDPASMSTCNCSKFDQSSASYDPAYGFTYDDLILHPAVKGYEDFYAFTYDPNPTDTISYTSAYSTPGSTYADLAKTLAAENNKFNCDLLKRTTSATPSPNYVLITELFYKQPQIFGFPLISNPFTDPVPMYAHTTMRMITSRSGNDIDKVGPVCETYPFSIKGTLPAVGGTLDIFQGGWLKWKPSVASTDATYLVNELKYPRMALNDFTDAAGPASDKTISITDQVATFGGTTFSGNGSVIAAINSLMTQNQRIRVPVVDNSSKITGFAWVIITTNNITGSVVSATYQGNAAIDDANGASICPATD